MSATILYISYDGMLEPLGQSQVLAYLKRLAQKYSICLISFEKPEAWRIKRPAGRCRRLSEKPALIGIHYVIINIPALRRLLTIFSREFSWPHGLSGDIRLELSMRGAMSLP